MGSYLFIGWVFKQLEVHNVQLLNQLIPNSQQLNNCSQCLDVLSVLNKL